MSRFQLISEFAPKGDQPKAIDSIVRAYRGDKNLACLLGVTGSGKTFTMANVIEQLNVPALVISHNKTLAAQLYEEFKELFPNNAVEYFVSYYDYYQPEAYIPQRDIYIEKDAARNDDLDRLRLSSTSSIVSRRDTIIVASVSCIFGLGSPDDYKRSVILMRVGTTIDRDELLKKLVDLQYERNDIAVERGKFRVRGDVIELYPAYAEVGYRIEMFGDEIEKLETILPASGESIAKHTELFVYPAVHYVLPEDRLEEAIKSIRAELDLRLMELRRHGKLLEAQRLAARTKYDVEMMLEVGYCSGIENYSRHLNQSPPGSKPYTLMDYFPKDYLLIIDESHATIPQVGAMFNGDQARKRTLVEHGFRLPSALDNRPLKFDEFENMWNKVLFVSATPGPFELDKCEGEIVEQIIRPTGLLDPIIHVKPARGQVPDLLERIKQRVAAGERALVTTLTKRLAEDLSRYIHDEGLRCQYLHSEVDTLERVEILQALRRGEFDVLVGVNLLREGLDLPEVSLVAILDADKEGFLRSETSLIQTIGRTARNVNAEVFLYGDKVTGSMQRAMDETERRRKIQAEYNEKHGITPETVRKAIRSTLQSTVAAQQAIQNAIQASDKEFDRLELIKELESQMLEAAENLEFERAAKLRDRVEELKASDELVVRAPSDTMSPSTTAAESSGPRQPKRTSKGRTKRSRS